MNQTNYYIKEVGFLSAPSNSLAQRFRNFDSKIIGLTLLSTCEKSPYRAKDPDLEENLVNTGRRKGSTEEQKIGFFVLPAKKMKAREVLRSFDLEDRRWREFFVLQGRGIEKPIEFEEPPSL